MSQQISQLLLFAHPPEAQAFLSSAPWQKLPPLAAQYPRIYRWGHNVLLITGQGPAQVIRALTLFFQHYQIRRLINLGIAGTLTPKFAVGEIVQVKELILAQNQAAIPLPCLHPTLPQVSLLSVEQPQRYEHWAQQAEIVDCELASAVLLAGQQPGMLIQVGSIKLLSDDATCTPPDSATIQQAAGHHSAQLLARFRELPPV